MNRLGRLLVIGLLWMESSAFAGVVQPLRGAPQLVILAAGNTPGVNGTFFRSDITILNLGTNSQNVNLQWLPQVGAGAPVTRMINIPAFDGVRSADFVRDYFGKAGLGSIVITALTPGGALDPDAILFASSRIWTPQPGTAGTTSQTFPAIPLSTRAGSRADVLSVGAADNTNYRVNVGVVNLDPENTQTFYVEPEKTIGPPTARPVTLPPLTMQQISLSSESSITLRVLIFNRTAGGPFAWAAYASTIDNVTGDSWSEIAVPTP